MEEKLRTLIEKLIIKTDEKKAIWLKVNSDLFVIYFKDGILNILCESGIDSSFRYQIGIFNMNGDLIYQCYSGKEDHDLLRKLYTSAKNAYYETDKLFELVLKEIDTETIIGHALTT